MSALDLDDDGECPVCLEPLSFSFRLPGEKPHIVPECGHALHEVCPTRIYLLCSHGSSSITRPASLPSMDLFQQEILQEVSLESRASAYAEYAEDQ